MKPSVQLVNGKDTFLVTCFISLSEVGQQCNDHYLNP